VADGVPDPGCSATTRGPPGGRPPRRVKRQPEGWTTSSPPCRASRRASRQPPSRAPPPRSPRS
jgi:hypothetical protein